MQPRSACEAGGIEIQRYREKEEEKHMFVFVRMYERSKLLLAMVLGPYKKEEEGIFFFLGMYECSKLLLAKVLGPLVLSHSLAMVLV